MPAPIRGWNWFLSQFLQRQVGIVLTAFSAATIAGHFMLKLIGNEDWFTVPDILYWSCLVFFIFSTLKQSRPRKAIQVVLCFMGGSASLISGNLNVGLVILVVAILLMYMYKFFDKRPRIKVGALLILYWLVFIFADKDVMKDGWIAPFMWVVFTATSIGLLLLFGRDLLQKVKEGEAAKLALSKLQNVKQKRQILRLIEICKELFADLNELLKKLNGKSGE